LLARSSFFLSIAFSGSTATFTRPSEHISPKKDTVPLPPFLADLVIAFEQITDFPDAPGFSRASQIVVRRLVE